MREGLPNLHEWIETHFHWLWNFFNKLAFVIVQYFLVALWFRPSSVQVPTFRIFFGNITSKQVSCFLNKCFLPKHLEHVIEKHWHGGGICDSSLLIEVHGRLVSFDLCVPRIYQILCQLYRTEMEPWHSSEATYLTPQYSLQQIYCIHNGRPCLLLAITMNDRVKNQLEWQAVIRATVL